MPDQFGALDHPEELVAIVGTDRDTREECPVVDVFQSDV